MIEDLLEVATGQEGLRSFLFIAETKRRERLVGVKGGFRRDPMRAIGELAIMKVHLATKVAAGI